MKMFVWDNVDHLTSSYHDGGGAVVIAEDEDAAFEALQAAASGEEPLEFWNDETSEYVPRIPATFSAEIDAEPRVFIFPDAGCC